MLVSVCMCTYKRIHLYKTLDSINELVLPKNITLEVIVVDNDAERSAEKIVSDTRNGFKYQIKYISQPYKNISVARNEYLKAAKGEYIASIDDDEIADKFWLSNLLTTVDTYEADIVVGQVIPTYPPETPKWIIDGKWFERERYRTGTVLTSGGAGCALIKASVLSETNYNFSLSFGLTGGEDAELFYRIHSRGYKIVYCKESFVTEEVERNRLNLNYLLKRAFRVGQTFSRYRYSKPGVSLKKLDYIARLFFKCSIFAFCFALYYFFYREKSLKYRMRLYGGMGKLSYFFSGRNIELYK